MYCLRQARIPTAWTDLQSMSQERAIVLQKVSSTELQDLRPCLCAQKSEWQLLLTELQERTRMQTGQSDRGDRSLAAQTLPTIHRGNREDADETAADQQTKAGLGRFRIRARTRKTLSG